MQHLDLGLFASNCRHSDARDREEQGLLLTRLLQVRTQLEDRGGPLMDAAQSLQQFLAQSRMAQGAVDLERVATVVQELLALTRDFCADEQPPAALPHPAAEVEQEQEPSEGNNPYADWASPNGAFPPMGSLAGAGAKEAEEEDLRLQVANSKVLGEILLQLGLVTRPQLSEALRMQSRRRVRIGAALVELGYITWNEVESAVRVQNKLRDSLGLGIAR